MFSEGGVGPRAPTRQLWVLRALTASPFVLALAIYIKRPTLGLDNDSVSYLTWSPARTSAYPLFLTLVNGPLLLPLQLFLLAAAIAWAILSSARWISSVTLAGLLAVGLSINPYVWQLQAMVMSEALTTPLLIIMLVASLGYLVRGERRLIVLASVTAALAAAARPSCLPLVLAPMLAVTLQDGAGRAERLRRLLLVIAVWSAIVVADRTITHAVHGAQTTSLAGRHMYAKAALIDAPPVDRTGFDPLERRLASLMEQQYASVRTLLKAAPAGSVRDALRLHYEVCAQYNCTEKALTGPLPDEHILNDARLRVGGARLQLNPRGFLSLAWGEYRGMWQLHPTDHPDNAAAINSFIKRDPLPFPLQMKEAGFPIPPSEQHGYYRVTRPAFQIIAVVMGVLCSILAVAILRGWRQPLVVAAFIAAASLQGVLVFGAFAGIGIPRYMMGMWPAIVCASAFSIAYVTSGDWLVERTRRGDKLRNG